MRSGETKAEYGEYAKIYRDAARVRLPKPDFSGISVERALRARRSVREYGSRPLTLKQMSQLAFAAYGATGKARGRLLRTAPSAGATYPLELYAVVNSVSGLKPGIYHYAVDGHALEMVSGGEMGPRARAAAWGQDMAEKCGVLFVITAVPERCTARYQERCSRFIPAESGHVAQNICLEAVSLGLGTVVMGAYDEAAMNALLRIDGKRETVIYLVAVGRHKRGE